MTELLSLTIVLEIWRTIYHHPDIRSDGLFRFNICSRERFLKIGNSAPHSIASSPVC